MPVALSATLLLAAARSPAAAPPVIRSGGAPDPRFDAELSAYQYPFPVKVYELRSQRHTLRMAYMDVPPDKGRPATAAAARTVVLLHGKNFPASYWEPTIRRLTAHGYRVIAPDQIGFGKSSKPGAYQFTFQELAANTAALLDAAAVRRVSIVGHSMGGMLAARFALMYPERVDKLALIDPLGLEDWKSVVPYRRVDEWYARELKATPETIRAYQRQSYYGGSWKPEYEKLIAVGVGVTLHPDYPKWAWCSALVYDMIFTQPYLYELPLLRPQTLLVIGSLDRTAVGRDMAPPLVAARLGNYPALARKAIAAMPNGKLVEIPGVGHLPQVQAFDSYAAALLGFLAPSPP